MNNSPHTQSETQFLTELEALIETRWDTLRPKPDDDAVRAEELDSLHNTILGGFVLLLASDNIADPWASRYTTRLARLKQNPIYTDGLIGSARNAY